MKFTYTMEELTNFIGQCFINFDYGKIQEVKGNPSLGDLYKLKGLINAAIEEKRYEGKNGDT